MNGLNNAKKTALVTGGTHGIGKTTAEALLLQGWEVYICGSNRFDNRGIAMEKEYDNLHYRVADITDEGAIKSLINEIFEQHGKLDLAFNNAGIGCEPKPPHKIDFAEFESVIRTNLIGTSICMKNEIAAMMEQDQLGIIINNASISAFKANTGADISYVASKAGIVAITREAAALKEYRDRILFYTLAPGYIETRMTAQDNKAAWLKRLPSGKCGKPKDVADIILHIAENPVFVSGQVFYVDGGDFLV